MALIRGCLYQRKQGIHRSPERPGTPLGAGGRYLTWKSTLLINVPLGAVTWSLPVVAPLGTVVLIAVSETTVNDAAAPLRACLSSRTGNLSC
jgi:hypothetical protein